MKEQVVAKSLSQVQSSTEGGEVRTQPKNCKGAHHASHQHCISKFSLCASSRTCEALAQTHRAIRLRADRAFVDRRLFLSGHRKARRRAPFPTTRKTFLPWPGIRERLSQSRLFRPRFAHRDS